MGLSGGLNEIMNIVCLTQRKCLINVSKFKDANLNNFCVSSAQLFLSAIALMVWPAFKWRALIGERETKRDTCARESVLSG